MKKKLFFFPVSCVKQWNALVSKFVKLYNRISNPEFLANYTIAQQQSLFSKLQNLFRRLQGMQNRVGIKLAGTVLALMLSSTIAFSQAVFQDAGYLSLTGTKQVLRATAAWAVPSFADLNNDGKIDLYLGTRDGDIRVGINDGTGVFAPCTQLKDDQGVVIMNNTNNGINGKQASPAFADLDGNGTLDLYLGRGPAGNIAVYKNLVGSGGVFQSAGKLTTADGVNLGTSTYLSPAFADIDVDGKIDMYAGNFDGNIEYYKNDGTGKLVSQGLLKDANGATISNGILYAYPAFTDIDGDGDMDLFLGGGTGSGAQPHVKEYLNNNGAFTYVGDLKGTNGAFVVGDGYTAPAFADIDNDGVDELMVGCYYTDATTQEATVKKFKFVSATSTAVPTVNENSKIQIFPNPYTGFVNFTGISENAKIKVFNLVGKQIMEFKNAMNGINVSSLTQGAYIISVVDGNAKVNKKFIKE